MSWDYILLIFIALTSMAGSFFILRTNWKRYGLLYLISASVGSILCWFFVHLGLYSFPVRLFPGSPIPLVEMFTALPFLVLIGVRYSPVQWAWKIPFYWVLVHLVVFLETLFLFNPKFITYQKSWDSWDSYTLWWIYFLVFEWIGGKIVPGDSRKPVQTESLRYGRWGWILLHAVLITTIFLSGFYFGRSFPIK